VPPDAYSVKVDGAQWLKQLAEKVARLKRNAEQENHRVADAAAERMKALAEPHVDSGRTIESIRVEHKDGGEAEIRAGGAAVFDEFGTSTMQAIPFFRPALAEAPAEYHRPTYH
jgi:HK97 gp10 family phage protein